MSKILKLDGVKIGRVSVCLEERTGNLRLGLKGKSKTPVEFAMDLPKNVRRAFRQMLSAAGYRDLAAQTVPPKDRKRRRLNESILQDLREAHGEEEHPEQELNGYRHRELIDSYTSE